MRALFHVSKRTLRVLAVLAATLVVVFVGLSRTEVGREGVRQALEESFAAQFHGTLSVGRLTGNFIGTLYAADVVIRDEAGRPVVTADRIRLHASLWELLRRRVRIRQAEVLRPSIVLRRDAAGWNVARVFTPRRRSAPARWLIRDAAVRVNSGAVDATTTGEWPRALAPFSREGRLALDSLDVSLRVQTRPGEPLTLTLDNFHFWLATTGEAVRFEGEARYAARPRPEGRVDGRLSYGRSHLDLDADWEGVRGPFEARGTLYPELAELLTPRPLPAPLEFDVRGEADTASVHVEHARLATAASTASASGTIAFGGGGVRAEHVVVDARVARADLRAAWPGAAPSFLDALAGAAVHVETDAAWHPDSLVARWAVRYAGTAGRLTGRGTLARAAAAPWHVDFTARPEQFAPGRLDERFADTDLTGVVRGQVRAGAGPSLLADATLRLRPSTLVGRRVDTLAATLTLDAETFALEGSAWRRGGRWTLEAHGPRDGSALDGTLATHDAPLSDVAPGPVEAVVTGEAAFAVRDLGTARPSGFVRFAYPLARLSRDTLLVTLSGLEGHAALTPDGRFDLRVESPAARLDGSGVLAHQAPALAWHGLVSAARHAVQRLVPASRDRAAPAPAPAPPEPFAEGHLTATLHVRQPTVLALLRPGLDRAGRLSGQLHVTADSGAVRLAFDGESPDVRTAAAGHGAVAASGWVRLERSGTLTASLDARADTLHAGTAVLPDSRLEASLDGRSARLRATARDRNADVLRTSLRFDLQRDVTTVHVDTLVVRAGPYALASPAPQTIGLYRDAMVFDDLELRSADDASVVRLQGALSPAPHDTLFTHVRALPLAPLTRHLNPRRFVFRGALDADVAFTGLFAQPELTGTMTVPRLLWGDDEVGTVRLSSFYTPGVPDVSLDLEVAPSGAASPDQPTNRVRVGGTFRLPRAVGGGGDGGALNLTLIYAEADAFFFDHLFPDIIDGARGRITGVGRIGGTLRRPRFAGQFSIEEARFAIPRFRVAFEAEAQATVDDDGIHVTDGFVRDRNDGVARLEGSLRFNDYRFFSLDVTGELSRLLILDVPQSPDLAFYGKLRVTGTTRLTGPLSAARLRSADATLSTDSEIFIPLRASAGASDPGFILFADSTGALPDLQQIARRTSVIGQVEGERHFVEGLDMDLSLRAPDGVTVNLVTDPLAGDVMRAVGAGRVQLVRRDGDFQLFGRLDVSGGEYLFTAGDVFVRRFDIRTGSITWDGDPLDPLLDVEARYATRASLAGTPYHRTGTTLFVPILVQLNVQDRLSALRLGLRLEFDRNERGQVLADVQEIEQFLNQPDRQAEYATSVLLTNSFLLTTSLAETGSTETLGSTGNRFAFASVSQLVATQLNRYLSAVLPGVDLNLGVQGERANDLDVTYGIALRLLDERLVIRGAGLLNTDRSEDAQGLQGEFVVEVRLSDNISVEVFYRREEDILQRIVTSSTGAGVSYHTQFTSWAAFWRRLLGDAPPPPAASTVL